MLDELLGLLNAPRDAVQNALGGRQGILDTLGIDEDSGLLHKALGFGVDLATDPLTYVGGLGGLGLGAKAGRGLAEAAALRGPRWGTTAEDLAGMLSKYAGGASEADAAAAANKVDYLRRIASPEVMNEIPKGDILGAGAEGLAVRSPYGNVARVGPVPFGVPGRPVADAMLPATRTADFQVGRNVAVRTEQTPFAAGVGSVDPSAVGDALAGHGLAFGDPSAANAGLFRGRPVAIDPGAVDTLPAFTGQTAPVTAAGQDPGYSRILDALGADQAVRRALGRGRPGPSWALPGAGVGGALGLAPGAALNAPRAY